jgi:hypothetical protein
VEVFLGGAEAAVAGALLDDLEVGAAGEPGLGGVGVAEVVDAHLGHQFRLLNADCEQNAVPGECLR